MSRQSEQIKHRRNEHRLLADVVDGVVTDKHDPEKKVRVRRLKFSRRRAESFGGIFRGQPTGMFKVWGYTTEDGPPLEATLEVGKDKWRIEGSESVNVFNVVVAHLVMVSRYGD